MSDFIAEIIHQLTAAGMIAEGQIEGCTNQDISQIEVRYGVKLPAAYNRFLLAMGRAAGKFLIGTDYLFLDVLELRDPAEQLLKECRSEVTLDRNDFVFLMHQGYQFLFFRCGVSDDPEVYLYLEGEESPRRVVDSFSQWLIGCVRDEITAIRELR